MPKLRSILDLTIAQIESIEDATGLPITEFDKAPKARAFTALLAAVEGKKRSEYASLTLPQIIERVAEVYGLSGDPDPEA